jgi:hypothetical protein
VGLAWWVIARYHSFIQSARLDEVRLLCIRGSGAVMAALPSRFARMGVVYAHRHRAPRRHRPVVIAAPPSRTLRAGEAVGWMTNDED